jgi:hypothetical protein
MVAARFAKFVSMLLITAILARALTEPVYWGPHRLADYDAAGTVAVSSPSVALVSGSVVT